MMKIWEVIIGKKETMLKNVGSVKVGDTSAKDWTQFETHGKNMVNMGKSGKNQGMNVAMNKEIMICND